MNTNVRKPAVSGRFYPSDRDDVISLIRKLKMQAEPMVVIPNGNILLGGIVPHAGYVYSARHAIPFFMLLAQREPAPDTVIVICPNHYGVGPSVALDGNDWWETPLGRVRINRDYYDLLDVPVSTEAHNREHSAEVMLPLLQYFMEKPFSILPISIKDQSPQMAAELADKIYKASRTLGKETVVIASSDFSHFVSPANGEKLDNMVLEKILKMDTEGVFGVVQEHQISVCGYGAVMTLMELGNLALVHPEMSVISRGHSGEVSPSTQVVHYITILMHGEEMANL